MKAVQIDAAAPGGGRLVLGEVERPHPRGGELLVRVRAAGVEALPGRQVGGDLLARLLPHRAPWIPGLGICGEVAAVGPEIGDFEPGDAVFAMLAPGAGGGFAEYAVVPHAAAVLKPDGLSHAEAAALVVGGLTAFQGLRDFGPLAPGERVAVFGAAGGGSGAGPFAVQLALAARARVTAVGGGEQLGYLRQLGAARVVDNDGEDFLALLPDPAEGRVDGSSYDLIFDAWGALAFEECELALAAGGVYLTTRRGAATTVARLRAGLAGVIDRRTAPRAGLVVAQPSGDDLAGLAHLVEAGRLRPAVDREYPLAEAAAAVAYLDGGAVRGQVVLSF
jgi:NADPH:quinone reductase-like Zn-dependent oxidoreductase